jgi:hypothetical protein
MKTYEWQATFHWIEDPHEPVTTFTTITRQTIRADSEDQAHDRVEEKLSGEYGKLLRLRIYVYELED